MFNAEIKNALNDIRFVTPTGFYRGPALGDLIETAIQTDPISVKSGTAAPNAGAGVEGNPGDLYHRDAPGANGGELWIKTGDANTAWSLVNTAAGDNLGNHSATQDLDMNGFDIVDLGGLISSSVADGAAAIGFELNTLNTLGTNGSKLFSLKNNGVEHMHARKGTDWWGTANTNIVEFKNADGSDKLQLSPETSESLLSKGFFSVWASTDFDYNPGYQECGVSLQPLGATASLNSSSDFGSSQGTANVFTSCGSIGGNFGPSAWMDATHEGDTTPHYLWMSAGDMQGFRYTAGGLPQKTNLRLFMRIPLIANGGDNIAARQVWGIDATGAMCGGSGPNASNYNKWRFESMVEDIASAIGFEFDTHLNLTDVAAKLISTKNFGTEKFGVDKDGLLYVQGTKVVSTQQAFIADPSGGATIDAEARTSIAAILDLLVAHGLMAAS